MNGMTVGQLIHMLKRLDRNAEASGAIAFKCGRCDGEGHSGDRLEASGVSRHEPHTLPRPEGKGLHRREDAEQMEGVNPNSEVQSWCWHDDTTVTVEILSSIQMPIGFVKDLGKVVDRNDQAKLLLDNVGNVLLQWTAALGFHSADVEICQRAGAQCPHKVQ